MKITRFEELEIWKLSMDIILDVYSLTRLSRFSRDYGLVDQIRRAVVSVCSNIAEGFEMGNNNDLIRFLRISKGSLGEVKAQLFIAYKLKYINEDEYEKVRIKLELLGLQIGKFISYLLKKKNNKEFKTH